jgi:hypothetical protein
MKKWVSIVVASLMLFSTLSSCSSIGLLSDDSSLFPKEIDSFSDFLSVWFFLQLSILLVGLLLGFFLGQAGSNLSTLLHFIWLISYRDYGFWTVLGLMIFLQIVLMLVVPLVLSAFRNRN